MENQLFEWKGWDEIDTMAFYFYDCTLKKQVGKFKAGNHFDSIAMMYDKAIIQLERGGEVVGTYELVLRVGAEK